MISYIKYLLKYNWKQAFKYQFKSIRFGTLYYDTWPLSYKEFAEKQSWILAAKKAKALYKSNKIIINTKLRFNQY